MEKDNEFIGLKNNYDKLQKEYESYQRLAETTMQKLNNETILLNNKLNCFINIVEVSRYINMYLNDKNLIQIINDIIVGVIGVSYSTYYSVNIDNELEVSSSNIPSGYDFIEEQHLIKMHNNKAFVLNNKSPIFESMGEGDDILSVLGVPVELNNRLLGYILIEHNRYEFFNEEHLAFMKAITNQIAVALENHNLYAQIEKSANTDALLNIYNRRFFFELIDNKIDEKKEKPFSIVMIDIDNFKKVNDTYGHPFGDEVLKETTRIIKENIDSVDIVARYGGEELILYIDEFIDTDALFYKIDNIRKKISENIVKLNDTEQKVTASFGCAMYPIHSRCVREVVKIADEMLYHAKSNGKNKVIVERRKRD